MFSSKTKFTDGGEITIVKFVHGTHYDEGYRICLADGYWRYLPKYRLNNAPKVGEKIEIVKDRFMNLLSVKLNGVEQLKVDPASF